MTNDFLEKNAINRDGKEMEFKILSPDHVILKTNEKLRSGGSLFLHLEKEEEEYIFFWVFDIKMHSYFRSNGHYLYQTILSFFDVSGKENQENVIECKFKNLEDFAKNLKRMTEACLEFSCINDYEFN